MLTRTLKYNWPVGLEFDTDKYPKLIETKQKKFIFKPFLRKFISNSPEHIELRKKLLQEFKIEISDKYLDIDDEPKFVEYGTEEELHKLAQELLSKFSKPEDIAKAIFSQFCQAGNYGRKTGSYSASNLFEIRDNPYGQISLFNTILSPRNISLLELEINGEDTEDFVLCANYLEKLSQYGKYGFKADNNWQCAMPLIPQENWRSTLDNFRIELNPEALKRARLFVDRYDPNQQQVLFLYGPYGTGKTHLAVAIAKALIFKKDLTVPFINCPEQNNKFLGKEKFVDEAYYSQFHKLAIYDDISVNTRWSSKIFEFLNEGRSLILTSNMTLTKLFEPIFGDDLNPKISSGRFVSRLNPFTLFIELKGEDNRIKQNSWYK